MRAAIVVAKGATHQDAWAAAIADGFRRHGITVEIGTELDQARGDFAVVWGARKCMEMQKRGFHVLVMERGYVLDRERWTSLGWNGLNGRAAFPIIDDPLRWERLFAGAMKEWRRQSGYALIMGQVRGDQALKGVDIDRWYAEAAARLRERGHDVRFRQHPVELRRKYPPPLVPCARFIHGSLEKALSGASLVVTYNSNSAVDAVLGGIAAHSSDPGSMAWPVTSHDLNERHPPRSEWAARLAWCQWQEDEIRDGSAWEAVRTAMPSNGESRRWADAVLAPA